MEIRRARPDDIERLLDGWELVAGERRWIGTEPGFDREARGAGMLAGLSRAETLNLLADDGAASPAGAVNGFSEHGRVGFGMWVRADVRGQGVGGSLLDAVVAWARDDRRAHKVVLEVWPHNEAAIALYRSRGFEIEGLRRRHWRRSDGSLWDAYDMGLVLDTTSPGMPSFDA